MLSMCFALSKLTTLATTNSMNKHVWSIGWKLASIVVRPENAHEKLNENENLILAHTTIHYGWACYVFVVCGHNARTHTQASTHTHIHIHRHSNSKLLDYYEYIAASRCASMFN